MSNLAITAEGLGKRYRIGAAAERPRTLREALASVTGAPRRNWERIRRLSAFGDDDGSDVIWALRDVSFDLEHGDVLGVIGRNGAGKSTLLKILSRITRPTTGRARIRGRVGSLLEVGTGFHPELTGRDNVYLNGSILGMSRADTARRFDQIVEFSGVGEFIDTPVKRYSSGMYLRLAFAVAAHLEPDVLIVDEVLAVGDLEFQQKCLRQMDEVAREGRTVLFVSHNLGAIQRLCTRSLLLDKGQVAADGDTPDVVKTYLLSRGSDATPGQWLDLTVPAPEDEGGARILAARYSSPDPVVNRHPFPGAPLDIALRIRAPAPIHRASIGFKLRDHFGAPLMSGSTIASGSGTSLPAGTSTWSFQVAALNLRPGRYQLDLWAGDSVRIHDHRQPALRLEVLDRPRGMWEPRFDSRCDGPVFCEYQVVSTDDHEPTAEARGTLDGHMPSAAGPQLMRARS